MTEAALSAEGAAELVKDTANICKIGNKIATAV
jgi:hypothetical protein